jgi:hypothetical protein
MYGDLINVVAAEIVAAVLKNPHHQRCGVIAVGDQSVGRIPVTAGIPPNSAERSRPQTRPLLSSKTAS